MLSAIRAAVIVRGPRGFISPDNDRRHRCSVVGELRARWCLHLWWVQTLSEKMTALCKRVELVVCDHCVLYFEITHVTGISNKITGIAIKITGISNKTVESIADMSRKVGSGSFKSNSSICRDATHEIDQLYMFLHMNTVSCNTYSLFVTC